jgi:hypothetical protein
VITEPHTLLIASFGLFQLKHYLFDYTFQTGYQLRNKGIYGHPGGLLHASLHALGSLPAILVTGAPLWFAGVLAGGEFLVHYHVDWTKEQIVKRNGWTSADYGFWQALGIDQMIHHLTYAAMLLILFSWLHLPVL